MGFCCSLLFFLLFFFFSSNENRVRGKDERSLLVLFQVPWVRGRLVFFFCWREISESSRDPRRSRTCGCCTWVTILHAWRVTRRNPRATRSSALNTPARADARGVWPAAGIWVPFTATTADARLQGIVFDQFGHSLLALKRDRKQNSHFRFTFSWFPFC